MKLYQKGYEVLCCRKNLKLKKRMGFSITLSDVENIPWYKIRRGKERKMSIKEYLHRLENLLMISIIDTCIKENIENIEKTEIKGERKTQRESIQRGKTYTKSLKPVSRQAEPYINRKHK